MAGVVIEIDQYQDIIEVASASESSSPSRVKNHNRWFYFNHSRE